MPEAREKTFCGYSHEDDPAKIRALIEGYERRKQGKGLSDFQKRQLSQLRKLLSQSHG